MIKSYIEKWKEAWNRFWFSPADPIVLSFMRPLVASMLLYTHAVWALDLTDFFGQNGVLPDTYRSLLMDQSRFVWSHLDWVSSIGALWFVHLVGLAIVFLWLIGYKTRTTGWLSCLLAISYANRSIGTMFGLDQINCFLCLYLAIGNAGSSFSVDRLLANRSAGQGSGLAKWTALNPHVDVWTNIATRLIQVHLCIVYLFAGLGKLQGESWWNGEAIWGAFASFEYQTIDMTWMAGHMWLVNIITLIALAWEVSYAFMIWKPLMRPIYLGLAVLVHLGIGMTMGMMTFGLIMIYGNLSFLEPSWIQKLVSKRE